MFNWIGHALVIIVIGLFLSFETSAQTIVSTSPTTKRAVLEEFGGIYCVYCPHGHEIIAAFEAGLGEELVLLNYQTGPYSEPVGNDLDLGNDYSAVLASQSQLTGYPAATINRQVFPGLEQGVPNSTAVSRSNWGEAIVEVLQQSAPVNIAAEATLNISTRQLELYLEYYYTEDVALPDNRLHVAILQNNVLGPQHGGNAGNYYRHQHLFREFITGQQGHIITNTEQGTFGSLSYQLELPTYYRDVWMDPANIEIAIFITEDEQEVLNGIEVHPTLISSYPSDVQLISIIAPDDTCDPFLDAEIVFRNDGNEALTSCMIHYGIEGGASNSTEWTGYLAPLEEVNFSLGLTETLEGFLENTFYVVLEQPNESSDPTTYNNGREHEFALAPQVSESFFELALRTDEFGYEIYWEVVDEQGTIHASGGNQVVGETSGGAQIATPSDAGAYESNHFIIEDIYLPFNGCYKLRVLDDYGDGLCCFYGNGFYRLRQAGEVLLQGAEFGAFEEMHFTIGGVTTSGSQTVNDEARPRLFPNPTPSGQTLQLQWPAAIPPSFTWQLFAASGTLLQSGNQAQLPHTDTQAAGYYLLQLHTQENRYTLPWIIQ